MSSSGITAQRRKILRLAAISPTHGLSVREKQELPRTLSSALSCQGADADNIVTLVEHSAPARAYLVGCIELGDAPCWACCVNA